MKKLLQLIAVVLFVSLVALPAYAQNGRGRGLERAIVAQEFHTDVLMSVQGVVGTGVGLGAAGQPVVKIFTESAGISGLPRTLDGVAVEVQVTGKIHALKPKCSTPPCGGGGGGGGETISEPAPPDQWNRPVPIGISTGNAGECSAGTIGARVVGGGNVYALSNNHVYALENTADDGSEVLQPGRFDSNCAIAPADVIGTLADFVPIVFLTSANNTVDAAIALSDIGKLDNSTPSDGYGTPNSSTVVAELGQDVQKYGRTSSLTKGVITAIHATLNIGYSSGTARFVNQIIVQSRKPFIKAGDSGSLLVTDDLAAKPVGLLYAGNGSGKLAVANEIGDVLTALGVTVDGK